MITLRVNDGSPPPEAPAANEASTSRPSTAEARRSDAHAGPIGLDAIVARRTPVLWAEAVAVVHRACAALIRDDGRELPAPDLAGISIHADGTVSVRPGASGEPAGLCLGRVLHALAPASATPAPLRLLITKWIDAAGPRTIAELAKELEFFVRPDAHTLIRHLYERSHASPVPPIPTEGNREAKAPAQKRRVKHPVRRARWFAAVAALVVFAVAGAWLAFGSNMASAAGSKPFQGVLDAVREKAVAAAASLATVAAGTTGTTPVPDRSSTMRSDSPRPEQVRRQARATTAMRHQPAARPTAVADEPAPPNPPIALDTPPAVPANEPDATEVDARPLAVYSSSDVSVAPPKMTYPQLPPPRFTGAGDVNTMEVIVAPDGRVERVELLSPPKRMTDMMLLSGAKTWRFTPAMFDGESVRYRLVVSWPTTP